MRTFQIDEEKAAEELHALIRECDGETLAAIYENAFGAVDEATWNDNQQCLDVTYHEGLEPEFENEIS